MDLQRTSSVTFGYVASHFAPVTKFNMITKYSSLILILYQNLKYYIFNMRGKITCIMNNPAKVYVYYFKTLKNWLFTDVLVEMTRS